MRWFVENYEHPYPKPKDVLELQMATGLEKDQILSWATNARKRNRKGTLKHGKKPHHFIDYLYLAERKQKQMRNTKQHGEDEIPCVETTANNATNFQVLTSTQPMNADMAADDSTVLLTDPLDQISTDIDERWPMEVPDEPSPVHTLGDNSFDFEPLPNDALNRICDGIEPLPIDATDDGAIDATILRTVLDSPHDIDASLDVQELPQHSFSCDTIEAESVITFKSDEFEICKDRSFTDIESPVSDADETTFAETLQCLVSLDVNVPAQNVGSFEDPIVVD